MKSLFLNRDKTPSPAPKTPTPPPVKQPTPPPPKEPTPSPPTPPKEEVKDVPPQKAVSDEPTGSAPESNAPDPKADAQNPLGDASNRPIVIINATPGDTDFQKTLIAALGGKVPPSEDNEESEAAQPRNSGQLGRSGGMGGVQPGMMAVNPMMMPYIMPPPPMPYYGMNPYYGPPMPPPPPPPGQYPYGYYPQAQAPLAPQPAPPVPQQPPPQPQQYQPMNQQQREIIDNMTSAVPPQQQKKNATVLSATEQLIETNPGRLVQEPSAQPQWTKRDARRAEREQVRLRVRKKLQASVQEVEQSAQLGDEKFEDSDVDDEFYNATVRRKDRKKRKSLADFNELQKEEMAKKEKIAEEERRRKEAELQEEIRRQVAEDGMNQLLAMIRGEEVPENKDTQDGAENSTKPDEDVTQTEASADSNSAKPKEPKDKKDTFKKPFDIEAKSPIIFPSEQTYDDFSRLVAEMTKESGIDSPVSKNDNAEAEHKVPEEPESEPQKEPPLEPDTPSPFSVTIADDLLAMISNSTSPARTPQKSSPSPMNGATGGPPPESALRIPEKPRKNAVSFAPSPLNKKHHYQLDDTKSVSASPGTPPTDAQKWLFDAQVKLLEAKRLLSSTK